MLQVRAAIGVERIVCGDSGSTQVNTERGVVVNEVIIEKNAEFDRKVGESTTEVSSCYMMRILGLTHYLFHRSTTAIEPLCYLQDLFTASAARGKGVGRALINGVYEQARLAGSPRVYWQTHQTNLTAMQLYDKVAEHSGFVVYRKVF